MNMTIREEFMGIVHKVSDELERLRTERNEYSAAAGMLRSDKAVLLDELARLKLELARVKERAPMENVTDAQLRTETTVYAEHEVGAEHMAGAFILSLQGVRRYEPQTRDDEGYDVVEDIRVLDVKCCNLDMDRLAADADWQANAPEPEGS